MMQRRKFILGSTTLAAIAAFSPLSSIQALAQTKSSTDSSSLKLLALQKKWVALYDSDGLYVTDIQLIKSTEKTSDPQLQQFSLRWKIRDNNTSLKAATYVIEDFSSQPIPIYLEPSYSRRRNGKFYRTSISLLRG